MRAAADAGDIVRLITDPEYLRMLVRAMERDGFTITIERTLKKWQPPAITQTDNFVKVVTGHAVFYLNATSGKVDRSKDSLEVQRWTNKMNPFWNVEKIDSHWVYGDTVHRLPPDDEYYSGMVVESVYLDEAKDLDLVRQEDEPHRRAVI